MKLAKVFLLVLGLLKVHKDCAYSLKFLQYVAQLQSLRDRTSLVSFPAYLIVPFYLGTGQLVNPYEIAF